MKLTWKQLYYFTIGSVDPKPLGTPVRKGKNTGISDEELMKIIEERNKLRKPTFLLRDEYETRLKRQNGSDE